MGVLHGKDGSVTFSNGQTYVKSWTINYVADAPETTNFDDSSGSRTYIPGLKSWSGSFDCLYSTANTAIPGTTGNAIFKTSTGTVGVWSGGIIITSMDITTPRDGLVTQSYSFQGSGVLSASS
ncbi:MAG: hypothetical protein ACTSPI_13665 [Candidatus Heimdallarchaeaceae archaeon]